jgi:23S rRNA (guanosine2251-2'-O)-methyltransferase
VSWRSARARVAVLALLVAGAGVPALATPAAAQVEEARVTVRAIDGQDVTLDVVPPASFGGTLLPASAFRVLQGTEQREASVRRIPNDAQKVVLVVDPQLNEDALEIARSALADLVRSLPAGTPMAVVVAGDGNEVLPPTTDAEEVAGAVAGVEHATEGSMASAVDEALDVFGEQPGRVVVVAVNGGHFERPGPVSEALEDRIAAEPAALYFLDVRQAALGISEVEPPGWTALAVRREVLDQPTDLGRALDRVAGELVDTYELRTTLEGQGPVPASVEISAGGRQAQGVTIVPLASPPKPPIAEARRGPSWPLLVGLVGLGLLAALLYIPRRRRRRRASVEFRRSAATTPPRASGVDVGSGAGLAPAVSTNGRSPAPPPRTPIRPSRVGGEQVEGAAAVMALLRHGRPVRGVLLGPDLAADDRDELLVLAARRRVRVTEGSEEDVRSAASSLEPGGAVAWAVPMRPAHIDQLSLPVGGDAAVVVGVPARATDEELGAVLREGERVGLTGLLVEHRPGDVVTPRVAQVAAGGAEGIGIATVRDLGPGAARLRSAGALLVGVEAEGAPLTALTEALAREPADRPVVVLLGGREGLGRQVARRCHLVVGVPAGAPGDELLVEQWRRVADVLDTRRRAAAGGPGEGRR